MTNLFLTKRIQFSVTIFLLAIQLYAQDSRSQLPAILQKSYFELNYGLIHYPFGQEQLEAGYILESAVTIPAAAFRLTLLGYEFNKYLSGQLTYTQPVLWLSYGEISRNGSIIETTPTSRRVTHNIGGIILKPTLPLGSKFSLFGEVGLNFVTRIGFKDTHDNPILKSANYATYMLGGGFKYHINNSWAINLVANYTPESKIHNQPPTTFVGAGLTYHLQKISAEQIKKTDEKKYLRPKQWLQVGHTSNLLGYGVNNFISSKMRIFGGGWAEVENGVHITYQRNIFNGPKLFSLDWGINASSWKTKINNENFFTLSVFPVFRFNYWHAKKFDAYFYYSVAGPSYISKTQLENHKMGGHFLFQDNMGTGVFLGKNRKLNTEIRIGHYSNGNMHIYNDGVKIPLSLNVGYAF